MRLGVFCLVVNARERDVVWMCVGWDGMGWDGMTWRPRRDGGT